MSVSIQVKNEHVPIEDYRKSHSESIEPNNNNFYLITKRLVDVVGSFLGLLVLLPLFLFVAIAIKIENPKGSVFFKQKRVGKNGQEFYMYKFRSMVDNAEELKASLLELNEVSGPAFKIKSDPRVTKIGKVIRRTSIDELPQLYNVLKRDMSLVGPRPPLPEEVVLYNKYEKQRLCVIPGLTCFWQVNGRSSIGFDEWVDMDLKYIQQRCVLLDFKLILRTIFVIFGSKDAY